jgi:hypothetical protein
LPFTDDVTAALARFLVAFRWEDVPGAARQR